MSHEFGNDLLAKLSPDGQQHVLDVAEFIRIPGNKVIYDADAAVSGVYFLESGMATICTTGRSARSIDVCIIGKEGFLGWPLFLGLRSSPFRTMMRIEGSAFYLSEERLPSVLSEVPSLRPLMLRFFHFSMVQVSQSAACNGTHTVGQRLARRLLMMQDRLGGKVIFSTHEALAEALGVRRPGVGDAVKVLERSGALHQGHGRILVMDRNKLIEASCGCYEIVRGEDDRGAPDHPADGDQRPRSRGLGTA